LTPGDKNVDCHWFFITHKPWPKKHPAAFITKKEYPSARPSVKAVGSVVLGNSNARSPFADKAKAK
jgi:hypothetical protein